MESEFFGHKKGSFTGAHVDKPGLFQAADGGTLFLDEVAELPLPMQVKLLRAIQEKCIRPVGANIEVPVDVRILSATHKDLAGQIDDGRFRHDLYYRINVIELRVPPLRERLDDLPGLCAAILQRLSGQQGRTLPALTPEAVDALRAYPFPGNVRELENILERALALAEDDRIEASDLRLPVYGPTSSMQSQPRPSAPPPRTDGARPAPRRPARQHEQRVAQLHRGNRAQRDPAGARRQPLQQDEGRRATGHHLPRAALQAEEAGDRLMREAVSAPRAPRFGLLLGAARPARLSRCASTMC
jgi:two-component system response regulator PilR (NtrC family)